MDRGTLPATRSHGLPVDPFAADGLVGEVFHVGPASVRLSVAPRALLDGAPCAVGEYVVVDCDGVAVFGRLVETDVPDGKRPSHADGNGAVSARATAQLLTSVGLETGKIVPGVSTYPRLGSRVYAAHPLLIKWVGEESERSGDGVDAVVLDLATLDDGTPMGITPERLFGRHCALLGATGGGKSWTVARVLESSSRFRAKLVLIDPTGEYHTLGSYAHHISIGGDDRPAECREAVFPYRELLEEDLVALFRPESSIQLARMRSAIKSLKLAAVLGHASPLVAGTGCIPKAQQPKIAFDDAYKRHIEFVESREATFEVTLLPEQIRLECVYPSAGAGQTAAERATWGGPHEDELSEVDALIARIESHLHAPEFACIFGEAAAHSVPDAIRAFLESDESVLRISLRQLSFADSIREIVANAIGRRLLQLGRHGDLAERPTVVIVDEAHQFLNHRIGNDRWSYALDAFEVIAKEGRKFALTVCLATQRPRDIPEGVLSQMGTFVVHRLINDADRAVVERASGEIDRDAARFLPTLGPGHAVVIGVDVPMPLTLRIRPPEHPPESRGPDYQAHWR